MLPRQIVLTAVLLVGGVLAAVGLFMLATPVTVEVKGSEVACGSGFHGLSRDADLMDTGGRIVSGSRFGSPRVDACSSAIATRRAIGWPLGGAGVALLIVGFVMYLADTAMPKATPRTQAA